MRYTFAKEVPIDLHIHVYCHPVNQPGVPVSARLDTIETLLRSVLVKEQRIMSELTDLQAQVAQNTAVEQSAIVLIQGIADRIEAARTDPAALQALTQELRSMDEALAAAVAANTPAAPAP